MIHATILDPVDYPAGVAGKYVIREVTGEVSLLQWPTSRGPAVEAAENRWVTVTDGRRIQNWVFRRGLWDLVNASIKEDAK